MLEVAAGGKPAAAVPPEILDARQSLASALHHLMNALARVSATGTTVEIASGLTAAMHLAQLSTERVEKVETLLARAATLANSSG